MQRQNSGDKVTLAFSDTMKLWAFAQTLECKKFCIDVSFKLLICSCSEKEIALAEKTYGATVPTQKEYQAQSEMLR